MPHAGLSVPAEAFRSGDSLEEAPEHLVEEVQQERSLEGGLRRRDDAPLRLWDEALAEDAFRGFSAVNRGERRNEGSRRSRTSSSRSSGRRSRPRSARSSAGRQDARRLELVPSEPAERHALEPSEGSVTAPERPTSPGQLRRSDPWRAQRSRSSARANRRRQSRPAYELAGFKPDRVAMWAVLLGVLLLVVAATSAHP